MDLCPDIQIEGQRYMLICEDWQGATVYEVEEPAIFVYWPFGGTA
jgi:hypothetical protein